MLATQHDRLSAETLSWNNVFESRASVGRSVGRSVCVIGQPGTIFVFTVCMRMRYDEWLENISSMNVDRPNACAALVNEVITFDICNACAI